MFLSLAIIFFIGILGGIIFEKIKIPKIIFYLLLGILMGPSVLNIIDNQILEISTYLRQIALVIILTRSGLSLDYKMLIKLGRPAILMCFLPACFEILGCLCFAPLLLNISIPEALLLGSVLGAVSPAIIVPRMIRLIEDPVKNRNGLGYIVMAGASCDDIFVIILFYAFKSLASSNFSPIIFLDIPSGIILGITLGIIAAVIILFILKFFNNNISIVIILLGFSFFMLYLEELLKPYVAVSSLLAIVVLSVLILKYQPVIAKEIQKSYNGLWQGFEILLFVLVGAITDVNYLFSQNALSILLLLLISLSFRSLGVLICLIKTDFTIKQRLYIILSYLPKATVQASIGAIALNEGLACGTIVLTAAVISIIFTAPIGAILMDNLDKKLLH